MCTALRSRLFRSEAFCTQPGEKNVAGFKLLELFNAMDNSHTPGADLFTDSLASDKRDFMCASKLIDLRYRNRNLERAMSVPTSQSVRILPGYVSGAQIGGLENC